MEKINCLKQAEKHLIELYNQDDLIKLIEERNKIEAKIFSGDLSYTQLTQEQIDEDLTDYEIFKETEINKKIIEEKDLYIRSWETLQAIILKPADNDKEGIKSWYHYEQGSNRVTICGQITVSKSIVMTLAGLYECDLMKFASFKEMSKIDKISSIRYTLKCRIQMPVGFSDRETIILTIGTFIPNSKDIFIPFKSINNGYYGIPKHKSNYEYFDIQYGFYYLKYIDENNCQLTNCYNLDPNISFIPQFILNQFMKSTIFNIMKDMKTQIDRQ